MEEIKVGDYVRTIYGEIAKITQVHPRIKGIKRKAQGLIDFNLIKKHSKNIIDLIEVGDYVNGYRVENVINEEPCPSGKCVDIDSSKDSSECTLWKNDIQTILTKEQYSTNCYKVGGEDE